MRHADCHNYKPQHHPPDVPLFRVNSTAVRHYHIEATAVNYSTCGGTSQPRDASSGERPFSIRATAVAAMMVVGGETSQASGCRAQERRRSQYAYSRCEVTSVWKAVPFLLVLMNSRTTLGASIIRRYRLGCLLTDFKKRNTE